VIVAVDEPAIDDFAARRKKRNRIAASSVSIATGASIKFVRMIEPKQLRRAGVAVSLAGHAAVLTVGLLFAGASPFDTTPVGAITVDIISADEIGQPAGENVPPPATMAFVPPVPAATTAETAPASPLPAPQPAPQAAPGRQSDRDTRQSASPPEWNPTPPAPAPPPAAGPWEPNIADMFGLPLVLPGGRLGGDFDAPAIDTARISANDTAIFRQHLKTCLTRPDSIAPTDKVRVVLRVALKQDGTLAATPALIEASASAKGPLLMKSAVDGLRACQPYAMLPADKYPEWKVLDLSFTPQDFAGG
jgi:hypothetical protein